MMLAKSQKLFLHNVLFSYLVSHPDLSKSVKSDVEDIMFALEDDILDAAAEDEPSHQDDEDADDLHDDEPDELEEEEEDQYADIYVGRESYLTLPKLRVEDNSSGEKNILEFYEKNNRLCFSLIDENGTDVSVCDVSRVTRGGKSLTIESKDASTWEFFVSKFPVEWTRTLQVNKVTAP
jgi:hypothetical protein